jgi:xanthine dehydrogenase molybdenum-binding subunit
MVERRLLVKGTPPPPLEREFTVVGQPLDRRDGVEKVTGRAKYSGDMTLPDMLYGKILHCPHPRARVIKINTRRAESLPGVRAVLTKENTKGWRTYWYEIPQIACPEYLTYEGQELAAVAAEDAAVAQRALELIDIEYEVLPPMLDAEEALKHPIPLCLGDEEYPGRDLFDRKTYVIKRGDIEKGFAEGDVVIEETYITPTQYHGTIQTRACVASWDGRNLTVWDATQGVWNSKGALAMSLGLNPDNVRVIVAYLGGGFGSKAWAHRVTYYAAKLSMVTGRPVRVERTRKEEFLSHSHRYNCNISLKMGAKKDGTLTAIYEKAILNIGAAASQHTYNFYIIWPTSNLYACPNVYLEQTGVYTNLQLIGPTRSPFNMPSNFALESHIDRMAEALNIDPLDFRLKNYVHFGSTHNKQALSGQERTFSFSSKKLDDCMRLATKAIGWERRKSLGKVATGTKKRGIGMAAFIAQQAGGITPNAAYADVSITHDGKINLHIGVVDIGGGQKTIFSMIAAEELGVHADDITVISGDTQDTRYAPSCHVSRGTAEMGPPVLQAAAEARQKLFEVAAPILGVKAEELQSENGAITVRSNPWRSISFKTVFDKIDPEEPVRGSGSRETNPNDPMFVSFGAQAAEVEVDIETGEIKILRLTAAQDFGKPINPKLCISQIYGGVEFGVGYALSEEGIYDSKTGKMLNPNFHQYRMPTSLDMPPIEAFLVESDDPYFAYSARGGAEVTNTPTPAAIRNAVYHATGIWFNHLPITPDKVIKAIQLKKGEK